MSPGEQRIIHNEALFREVNAHIADLEERVRLHEELLPLLCECANTGCTTIIEVEHRTFEGIRQDPLLFLVATGHERPDVESVVGRGASYVIVEKLEAS